MKCLLLSLLLFSSLIMSNERFKNTNEEASGKSFGEFLKWTFTNKTPEPIAIETSNEWESFSLDSENYLVWIGHATYLIKKDGLEFSELVEEVKKSPSTVSLYLSQIVDDGLVEIKMADLKKRYHIKVTHLVDKLVEEHRPGSLEKSTSGFEDIINSF